MPYFGIPIRNGLPIGLGSVAGFGIAPFSPESLFENGEVGAWYDPSDYSTLFTTSAGTTPVSAPGNGADVFVGLMLDKRVPVAQTGYYSGVFDGSNDNLNIADNAAFDFAAGEWTVEAWIYRIGTLGSTSMCVFGQSISGAASNSAVYFGAGNDGIALYLSTSGNSWTNFITTSVAPTQNAWQHIVWQRRGNTLETYLNGVLQTVTGGSAAFSGTIFNSSRTVNVGSQDTSAYFNGYISNLRVVKGTAVYTGAFTPSTAPLTAISGTSLLTCQNSTFIDNSPNAFAITANGGIVAGAANPFGNHAFQTSSTKRPELRARYNLLTYSEEFNNAAWNRANFLAFGSGSIVNAIAAPNGTVTADLLTESTAPSANFYFNQSTVLSASTAYTYSIYCKPNGRSRLYLAGSSTAWGTGFITYNLNTNVVSPSGGSGWTGTIENLPDGWYRITATRTTNAGISGGYLLSLFFLDNAGNVTYNGDGVSGMYYWGADLRPASQATGLIGPTYQRVAAANVYDTAGFLPYLSFDGVDDSMSTGSIDATAVDKAQVFAGVRKLSDATTATYQTIIELSDNSSTNNGSISQYSSGNANGELAFYLRGTASTGFEPITYNAPSTLVVTASYDIGESARATELLPRINGVLNQTGATGAADAGTGNFGNYPLFIGMRNNASLPFNGWLSSLIVRFGATLSQSQIEATESWVNQKTGAF